MADASTGLTTSSSTVDGHARVRGLQCVRDMLYSRWC